LNIQHLRDHCLSKKGVTEEFPFGNQTLVFKVGGKIFALADIDDFSSINLKCEPEEVVRLIDEYLCVQPGYHMNKKHWITVIIDGSIPDKTIFEWIDSSYLLVLAGLPGKVKDKFR
jgi:predicted DNA-binding protein (MmcQ/YjbR family)